MKFKWNVNGKFVFPIRSNNNKQSADRCSNEWHTHTHVHNCCRRSTHNFNTILETGKKLQFFFVFGFGSQHHTSSLYLSSHFWQTFRVCVCVFSFISWLTSIYSKWITNKYVYTQPCTVPNVLDGSSNSIFVANLNFDACHTIHSCIQLHKHARSHARTQKHTSMHLSQWQ